ncbi:MAG: B12-binding domain-containing radical SAM protein [Candidatus Helarchaeota archaeon]
MDFLIVDALSAGKGHRRFTRDVIGCGPRLIAGLIENKFGHHVKISFSEHVNLDLLNKFDVLFISAMSMDLVVTKRIAQKWRRNKKDALIVIGGPITNDPCQVLSRIQADIAIIGEAEHTILELFAKDVFDSPNKLEMESLGEISGIAFKTEREIIINPSRKALTKAEFNLFRPSIERIQDYPNHATGRVYVECVRGCSNFLRTKVFLPDGKKCQDCNRCKGSLTERLTCPESIPPGCGFCSVPATFGPPKSRSFENITWEISELTKLGVKRIVLSAPDFLDYQREAQVYPEPLTNPSYPPANISKLEELLDGLQSLPCIKSGKARVFIENVKACLMTEEIVSLIARYLPGTVLSMGCESGSEVQLRVLGKPSFPSDFLRVARLLKKHGLGLNAYFIHGLPGEDKQVIKQTKELIGKLSKIGLDKITYYKFSPLPGTAFQDFVPKSSRESKMLSNYVIKINRELKKKYIGKILEVMIMETHDKNPTIGMGRILTGGPTVLVPSAGNLIGKVIQVRITAILSDRLIKGKIL